MFFNESESFVHWVMSGSHKLSRYLAYRVFVYAFVFTILLPAWSFVSLARGITNAMFDWVEDIAGEYSLIGRIYRGERRIWRGF